MIMKIIISFLVTFIATSTMIAESIAPHDWTFYYSSLMPDKSEIHFREWRKDGFHIVDTKTINGTEYEVMTPVNDNTELVYLRKEGSKLYILVDDYLVSENKEESPTLFFWIQNIKGCSNNTYGEYLLADYNCVEYTKNQVFVCWENDGIIGMPSYISPEIEKNYVVRVNNCVFRRQRMNTFSENDNDISGGNPDDNEGRVISIEGIGVDRGHFFIPVGRNDYTGIVYFENTPIFDRVEDGDGKVVFCREDFYSAPYEPDRVYESLIRSDRVWEYLHEATSTTTTDDVRFFRLDRNGFKGSVERFGKTYYRYVRLGYDSWQQLGDQEVAPEEVTTVCGLDEEIALLREENGKVYMLLPEEGVHVYDPADDRWTSAMQPVEPGTEVLLYDFTLDTGDARQGYYSCSLLNEGVQMKADGNIVRTGVKEVEGKELKWLRDTPSVAPFDQGGILTGSQYLEGVGNISEGDMTRLGYGDYLDLDGASEQVCFNRLYDASGNVLLGAEQAVTSPGAAIAGIEADRADDSRMYDLMGREIRNPLTGTVFIRGGKKFVAR